MSTVMPASRRTDPASRHADVAIVGAGIVGLTIARVLCQQYDGLKVVLFDKEPTLAAHASGRNSGVLHAGLYYKPDTLKAKLCANGARALAAYCEAHELPFKRVGKVVLPVRETDDIQLTMLCQRGRANGARVDWMDAAELKEREPQATTITGKSLWCPDTAMFDPKAIVRQLATDLQAVGATILTDTPVTTVLPARRQLHTAGGLWTYKHLINTAGMFADRMAHPFGVGKHYRMLPFKGLYYELASDSALQINHHIYPVPDLRVPFLGVHFTRTHDGRVTVGPTAIPALGREHYRGLEGLDWAETPVFLARLAEQYARNAHGFRAFAHQEAFRFFKPLFARAARALVPALRTADLQRSGKVEIRAQLLNTQSGQLEQDFVVLPGEHSTHVLNAVSPAFTASMAFAEHVVAQASLSEALAPI